jgi:glycosyltransferase involved in cell wall biosynthesis
MPDLQDVLEAHGLQHLERRLVQEEELTVSLLLMMRDLDGALAELDITGDDATRLVGALRSCPDAASTSAEVPPSLGDATLACVSAVPASSAGGVPAAGSLRDVRVAVVSHSGYFAGDSYGGATRASLALIRELTRLCGGTSVDVLALLPKPCPEGLVYALAPRVSAASAATATDGPAKGARLGLHRWEGHDVLIGDRSDLTSGLRGREYAVVLSLSIEASLLQLACALPASARYALAHNYYLPPFGPFRRHEPQPGHVELLRRMDRILSPCTHHCRYVYRWGPTDPPLTAEPLWAADYHYFHQRERSSAGASREGSSAGADHAAGAAGLPATPPCLPPPMRPWLPSHRFVTLVSPCPAKGISVMLALARRMPEVLFAGVPTGWTDTLSRQALGRWEGHALTRMRACEVPVPQCPFPTPACPAASVSISSSSTPITPPLPPLPFPPPRYPNITVLPPNDDVDLIFRQTRVLLAPSLWQECCPLVVMEALLRGIPCVSSDVLGMPEANRNPQLVCETRLCFDHARGELIHGLTNAQLEARLGAHPPPTDARQRSAALAASVAEEANDNEVAPFEEALRRLLTDEEHLRRQSIRCREIGIAFARQCEGGLARMLRALVAAPDARAVNRAGGNDACGASAKQGGVDAAGAELLDGASVHGGGVNGACVHSASVALPSVTGAEAAAAKGAILVPVSNLELKPQLESHAESHAAAAALGARMLRTPARYRVTFKPLVYLRAAPSTRAAILTVAPVGMLIEADATVASAEGMWVRSLRPVTLEPVARRGWALERAEGLGTLLHLESEGVDAEEMRS